MSDTGAIEYFVGDRVVHVAVSPHSFDGKRWTHKVERRDVRLMAVSDGWAMVRRPGCVPYVCRAKELEPK